MGYTAVIGQSGGPTVVINQSLVGAVEALAASGKFSTILGAKNAVRGIVDGNFVDLTNLESGRLKRLAATPSSALGSSRDKPDAAYCERILASFKQRDVRYFFYIGGNDSSDTCRIVKQMADQSGYELNAWHIPKTIDNDLMENDHTPGYASAAKFVAQAFMGDNLDNKALAGIKINIVMGRHAGFLTAAAAAGRKLDSDGPHLVYVPELAFDVDTFLGDIDRVMKQHKRCVIAVSEGIHDAAGTPIISKLAQSVEKDAHGNVQLSGSGALGDHLAELVKTKLGAKRVRADTLGYLQRCFPGVVSDVDAREANLVARRAVEESLKGRASGSVAIQRTSTKPYTAELKVIPLEAVAAKTRTMPREHLAGASNVSPAFIEWVTPLLGGLPEIEQL